MLPCFLRVLAAPPAWLEIQLPESQVEKQIKQSLQHPHKHHLQGDTHTSDPPRDCPTFTGAEHLQPGLSKAAAASCSQQQPVPMLGKCGLAWPRLFQAATVMAGERSVWAVSASCSIVGLLAPAPEQRQLHPSLGG